jgi:hypothetical protein
MNMRYVLSVPLVRKFSWLLTATVSNPFNHRGRANGIFGVNGPGSTVIYNTMADGGNGVQQWNQYVEYGGDPRDPNSRLVWGHFASVDGIFINKQSPRSIGVQTGLRF